MEPIRATDVIELDITAAGVTIEHGLGRPVRGVVLVRANQPLGIWYEEAENLANALVLRAWPVSDSGGAMRVGVVLL
jgi:hypothetical protein